MDWETFSIAGTIGLAGIAWFVSRRAYWWDYHAGTRAYRDGLSLNAGWSKGTRDGWADAWHHDRAARAKRAGPPWPTK